MMYFMELASPHSDEAIKLVDKVGGFEWFIQKYEMDGATALKLDLALDTPIIIVPRNSTSKELVIFKSICGVSHNVYLICFPIFMMA